MFITVQFSFYRSSKVTMMGSYNNRRIQQLQMTFTAQNLVGLMEILDLIIYNNYISVRKMIFQYLSLFPLFSCALTFNKKLRTTSLIGKGSHQKKGVAFNFVVLFLENHWKIIKDLLSKYSLAELGPPTFIGVIHPRINLLRYLTS